MIVLRRKWLMSAAAALLLLALSAPVWAQQAVYVVQPGDTLARIAVKYSVTMQALATANNLANPNLIYVGQRLVIPAAGIPVVQPTLIHVVARGEDLRFIAARYGTTWQAIAQANHLANPNLIYVGQRLVIPATGGPVVQPPPVAGRYTVQLGDTLFRISRMFGVDMWDLARANGILNLNQIRVGQSLLIPGR